MMSADYDRTGGRRADRSTALYSPKNKQKLLVLEENLAKEMGPLVLFGVFQPEDALWGMWDIVISSEYVKENGISKLVDLVLKHLKSSKIDQKVISRIVPLEPNLPFVEDVLDQVTTESKPVDMHYCELGGIQMRRAIIITSRRARRATRKHKVRSVGKARTV